MILRKLKNVINKLSNNLLIKNYNIANDKRLTQRPVFEVFFNERPGIKHPEITPTLPLLKYVHDNNPPIKIATMRLRESIFRRGFEWERCFESKCSDCGKEHEDILQQCDCGSKNIIIPNSLEVKRADKFFETCNIYDVHDMGKRKLLHLLKQIEDDINIYDDAYIIGIKEYWQDDDGNIKLTTLHQILRGNPITMRIVADEYGDPGGRWATCLRHRDVIEDIDGKDDMGRCHICGRKLYEVHYVSVEGGGDNPTAYYIGDEIIHVSKYSPSSLYGFSPIVTLWQYALTLTNMLEYIYRSYGEAHLPKGILAMKTSNPDSAYQFWKDVDDKLQKDPHYIPKMFLEGDGNGSGSGMEFIKFMDTLEEMQYIPVRDEIRRTIAATYGVTNIFIGDTAGVGGLNSESTQIDITNMAAESGISVYNEYIMPELLSWLNINDWKYILQSPFEENRQRELTENQAQVNIAQSMQQLGFKVELGEEDIFDFKYSGTAQNQMNENFNNEFGDVFNNNEELQMSNEVKKAKIYMNPSDMPENVIPKQGERGGWYYEPELSSKFKMGIKNVEIQIDNFLSKYDKFSQGKMDIEEKVLFANNILNLYNKANKNIGRKLNEYHSIDIKQFNDTLDLLQSSDIKDKAIGIDNFVGLAHYNNLFFVNMIQEAFGITMTGENDEEIDYIVSWQNKNRKKILDRLNEIRDRSGKDLVSFRKSNEVKKAKIYVKHPSEAPEGSKVQRTSRGALYYETSPQRPMQQLSNMDEKQRVKALLHESTEHYNNILDEYKSSIISNPRHAFGLIDDLKEMSQLIQTLYGEYKNLFGDQNEAIDELFNNEVKDNTI